MFNPVSTYRVQLNKDFTFKSLNAILPFLQKLGIKTVYASPIFSAVPGSMHGYDVINPYEINPEIGTEADLYAIHKKLTEAGMCWIQDIVPNHMAFHHGNIWLMDVLEKGNLSVYASFFDVAWSNDLFNGRLMVPFLSSTIEETIEKKDLQIVYDHDRLIFQYFESYYPLSARSYSFILADERRTPKAVQQWIEQLEHLHQVDEVVRYSLAWRELMLQFTVLMKEAESAHYVNERVAIINKDSEKLKALCDVQVYRLCSWQETDERINFRRFFTVNGLICLNMQAHEVFDHYHKKIKKFIDDGVFQGLRIDHIDGLYDPTQYIERLRALVGDETYIVVEKILEPGETLPANWPIQGTTGYDFLASVNNLFTRNNAESTFSKLYNSFLRDKRSIREQIEEKKALILSRHMGGELDNLYHLLLTLNLFDANTFNEDILKRSIGEFLIVCPVYRFYGNRFPLEEHEHQELVTVFKNCRKRQPALAEGFDLLEDIFLRKTQRADLAFNERAIQFYQRCMQFTGPLMAKGVEDTLMYTFNRFIGHNEVGDSPEFFGLTTNAFHAGMQSRQMYWPLTQNTTATHDTKRGEGVRMRLNVLPALADQWSDHVKHWRSLHENAVSTGTPDANDEYFIYQTLVGTLPISLGEMEEYKERLTDYLTKALRESKQHSGWSSPNETYEQQTIAFAIDLLNPDKPFWKSFYPFQKKVSDFGMLNSMAQVLLKFTCPGVPDIYQGTTSWDLSMVDPDNRRPVDFELRERNLLALTSNTKPEGELVNELWNARSDARIKLWLVRKLVNERNENKDLFVEGFYIPLKSGGKYKDNIVAFARRYKDQWYVVAAPLYLAQLCESQKVEGMHVNWDDTFVELPKEMPDAYEHILLNNKMCRESSKLCIKDIFIGLPLALLKFQLPDKSRSAGVLLPVASLPSVFGVGDFGDEARSFVDFLASSGQSLWQILPLNPTDIAAGHSPYSSHSSMAINTSYISLGRLAAQGLIDIEEIKNIRLSSSGKVNYVSAQESKAVYIDKAWKKFNDKSHVLQDKFKEFIKEEVSWLDDFVLYEALKNHFENLPWYEWPDDFKNRSEQMLSTFKNQNDDLLLKLKWLQFLAATQWKEIRQYCYALNIKILGDLPFYVSYDSADVWSNREIFSLDANGRVEGVAGVPPDYFDAAGQLWGMPTFRWDVLKQQGYAWWINRIRRNLTFCDILRFDHFRAFADYWEVPAGEKSAIHGSWKRGPRDDFFNKLRQTFSTLPFVAEDLGDVDDAVFALRDKFNLTGMKVLHFAFGSNMAESMYIPHHYTQNFVVYTGTHDNNTTRGWFRKDLAEADQKRLASYCGRKISERNVAEELIRLAYSSTANTVIVPAQDILNLDERARMNKPSSTQGNWCWALKSGQLNQEHSEKLLTLVKAYGR